MKGLLINEVAKAAGVHTDTVKRLDKQGLIKSQRDWNGWRRYAPETVGVIRNLYGLDESENGGGQQ